MCIRDRHPAGRRRPFHAPLGAFQRPSAPASVSILPRSASNCLNGPVTGERRLGERAVDG
eukprot:11218408-Alexandrium_andersonii.AAC.1